MTMAIKCILELTSGRENNLIILSVNKSILQEAKNF